MSARLSSTERSRVTMALLIAAGVTAVAIAHVGQRQDFIRVGYQLSSASSELRELEEQNARLGLELSVLTDPERIGRIAGKLGMRLPNPEDLRLAPPPVAQLRRSRERVRIP